jgi:hypothetical protein
MPPQLVTPAMGAADCFEHREAASPQSTGSLTFIIPCPSRISAQQDDLLWASLSLVGDMGRLAEKPDVPASL